MGMKGYVVSLKLRKNLLEEEAEEEDITVPVSLYS